ncbi:uncharacterized protein LOC128192291 isoform X6 [Crassostrea angulata]|uniref:uncharacterized protein LOC128192291 isoform X6 n=1 Tax=Magallana angulata TaxID=2784310 RepID=UPI0022B0B3B4|nr:uncharacterized protein LOC128192291 isoform X6 [Crassostrea angulata]
MPGGELHPSNKNGSGSFRFGTNRQVELTLRKELDDMAKKSLNEIAVKREERLNFPQSDEIVTSRKLQPAFVPERRTEKRKTEPVFHEESPSKEAKKEPKFMLKPVVEPPYNPLDKSQNVDQRIASVHSRKLPFSKETTITTDDLKKPKVSSIGIVPSRSSVNVPGLKVIMEGKPALTTEDSALEQMMQANKMRGFTPLTSDRGTPRDLPMQTEREEDLDQNEETEKKPAILMSEGTLQRVAFKERPKPIVPTSSLRKTRRRAVESSLSIATSLKSENNLLPDENVYSRYDEAIAGIDDDLQTAVSHQEAKEEGRRASSAVSSKSTKDLLEEAKKIAKPGAEPMWKIQGKKSPRKKEGKKSSSKDKKAQEKLKSKEEEETDGKPRPRSERSVDEIIASLRAQSSGARTQVSDADRKIQEIMDRVMSRASAVLSDGSDPMDSKRDSEIGSEARSTPHTPLPGDGSSPSGEDQDDKKDIDVPADIPEDEEFEDEALELEEREEKLPSEDLTSEAKTGEEEPEAPAIAEPQSLPAEVPSLHLTDLGGAEDDSSSEEGEEEELVDIKQAWEDLMAPPEATCEDIVSVQGKNLDLLSRQPAQGPVTNKMTVFSDAVSFLSTWKPITPSKYQLPEIEEEEKKPMKRVHHFCTVNDDYQLPNEYKNLGRKYHTPSKFDSGQQPARYVGGYEEKEIQEDEASVYSDSTAAQEAEEKRLAIAARRVLEETKKDTEETLEAWQQKANEVFNIAPVSVEGTKMSVLSDESRLYWTPAPPKFDVQPARVKDVLFPDYQPASLGMDPQEVAATRQMEEMEESSEEEEEMEMVDSAEERYQEIYRLLYHKSTSMEDLTEFVKAAKQREDDIKDGKIYPYEKRKLLKEEQDKLDQAAPPPPPPDAETKEALVTPVLQRTTEMTDNEIFPVFVPLRRSTSTLGLSKGLDDTLLVPQDYNAAMEEISTQKSNVRQMKLNKKLLEAKEKEEESRLEWQLQQEKIAEERAETYKEEPKMKDEPTPAELALQAGRAYVILPKKGKKKSKRKAPISMERLEQIEKFLRAPPKPIERSNSMLKIVPPVERELRVSSKVRQGSRLSLPNLLDFDSFTKIKKMPNDCVPREWVRDMWNGWFDQVFPPTPSESEDEEPEYQPDEPVSQTREEKEKEKKRKDSLSSYISDALSEIEPLDDSEQNIELHQIIHEEIQKLTGQIAMGKPKAFDLCRRGALYRKVGMIKAAQIDLDLAIKMEPLLLDAYWHRHLLYLLKDQKQQAKADLTFILKYNNKHGGAYRSMAEILRKENNPNDAIINYSMAIKLNPRDHEAYFQRAAMYEKTDKMPLALDDFMMCKKILPTRTDAILKHAMYYFQQKNWNTAIQDFTDLLRVDPLNSMARMYRGRALAEQTQWNAAVEDLSAAIHLDPKSWQAFFYRACILRKAHPKQALHDYSVSLLINDNDDNVMSYLHRGILYNSMNRFEDAIPDFESVLKLNKDIACAHVNLGLIYMNHYENYHRAIKKFTAGIKVDPTYVRAYVCRGEAYHKIHDLRAALKDFTRAIHLRPDVHHYYMYRGQLVLELGNLEMAAFCVKHASEMSSNSSLGEMPTQQAVVQSFLKNYDKAIEALNAATRVKPVPPLFMLLGKTQMKAKVFKDAITSFDRALQLYKPWRREPWPMEASECHFLIGMCHIELKGYHEAKDAFTSAVKINPNYAQALYQRGVAKMKLSSRGLSREGIQDFNRALAINPRIFQAYLSRACYYGMKKNYTKAILNCNEATKLQPRSVRAYLYRGALKYHIKAYDLAIRDLDIAIGIDSTCDLAFFNRAVCYQEKKNYHKSLKDYGIVLLLGDDNRLRTKVLINRGLLYFSQKDYTNALYDFKMAAKLDPQNYRILHTLGLCYHKMDRLKEAVGVFTSCLERNPFFLDGIIARGNVYMDYGSQGGIIYARRDYERVLMQNPLHLPARVNLAYTLQVSGKFMHAWRQFTAAIEINPRFKPALEGRAVVNLQMSNTFAAFQDICESIKVSPTAELLTNRGVINQFMKDRVNAMKDYQNAIRMDPTYSLAYFNAANVYFHTRHFKQALNYYNSAVEHNPQDESALLNRAITKVMLRDSQGALGDFKAAIKLSPHTAHMYFNRGNLYASMEQFDQAEKDYSKALSLKPDDPLVLKRRADVLGKLGKRDEAIEDYKRAVEIQSHLTGN